MANVWNDAAAGAARARAAIAKKRATARVAMRETGARKIGMGRSVTAGTAKKFTRCRKRVASAHANIRIGAANALHAARSRRTMQSLVDATNTTEANPMTPDCHLTLSSMADAATGIGMRK